METNTYIALRSVAVLALIWANLLAILYQTRGQWERSSKLRKWKSTGKWNYFALTSGLASLALVVLSIVPTFLLGFVICNFVYLFGALISPRDEESYRPLRASLTGLFLFLVAAAWIWFIYLYDPTAYVQLLSAPGGVLVSGAFVLMRLGWWPFDRFWYIFSYFLGSILLAAGACFDGPVSIPLVILEIGFVLLYGGYYWYLFGSRRVREKAIA